MSLTGRLFIFEGVDGVGKTALSTRLAAHMAAAGALCELLAFPGRSPGTLGAHVYRLHHVPGDFGVRAVTAASLQVLHVAAHLDAIERQILPALRAGRHVVLDRFWWSTWVYGVAGGADPAVLRRAIDVERGAWAGVRPAVAFLVERRVDEGPAPVRGEREARVAAYRELAAAESRGHPVLVVANDNTLEEAFGAVVACVGDFVGDGRTAGARAGAAADTQRAPASDDAPSVGAPRAARWVIAEGRSPTVVVPLAPAETTVVYDTFWRFAAERQAIFHRKAAGRPGPWTADEVLLRHKFTNCYRASDRVSQYLIREVQYRGDPSPDEVFFRTLLFKLFNRVATWELLRDEFGTITYREFSVRRYDDVLCRAMDRGERVYSPAYIMPSGGRGAGVAGAGGRKHRMHLELLARMMAEDLPARVAGAGSMRRAFELLRAYPTIGDFLAYQFVTDLNYSTLTDFSEMEFVTPGPGARDGLRKCFKSFGGLTEAQLIRRIAERQDAEFDRLGLSFQNLWGRPLQLIDCQNLLCEVDKYARVRHPEVSGLSGRTRIKQVYRPDTAPLPLWYPPKWGINDLIIGGSGIGPWPAPGSRGGGGDTLFSRDERARA